VSNRSDSHIWTYGDGISTEKMQCSASSQQGNDVMHGWYKLMKPKDSCPQKSTNGPCLQPVQSNPYPYMLLLHNSDNTHASASHIAPTLEKYIYRVSQEECAILRESVPYVKLYRHTPKHLYPNLNGYGDNGQRKGWTSWGSTPCTCQLTD
jgi:hypothetical protein